MILWPGIEGYNYPFQTPYREAWARFVDGVGEVAARCQEHGISLFLEHKNSEPAMKILMRNVGMTLHVIHTLRARGITSVKVNMDWQHLLMNGESLAEYAALLAAEGLLGHQHANSGWGTFDDDNMVGATAFMETLELARRAASGRLRRERRAARLRPLPVHRGRRRGGSPQRSPVAVHRLRRGEDRRRGAPRGAGAQGRSARLRARLRSARRISDDGRRRARRRDDRRQGDRDLSGRRASLATAERSYPLSTPHPGWSEQDPEDWWTRSRVGARRGRCGTRARRHRPLGSDARARRTRRR